MSQHLEEMITLALPHVVAACRIGVRPFLESQGIPIVSQGETLGDIQTEMDIRASEIFLDGAPPELWPGLLGMRTVYPGSLTEENDDNWSERRWGAEEIYQNDPNDGTGDAVATVKGDLISPTNLTSKLMKDGTGALLYTPRAGMIFHIMDEYALVSDGREIALLSIADDGSHVMETLSRVDDLPNYKDVGTKDRPLRLGIRRTYPQQNYDERFPQWLEEQGVYVQHVDVGGAGTQGLQFFRTFLDSSSVEGFHNLEPIDALFTAQPDWKTWDTDPIVAIARNVVDGARGDDSGHPTGLKDIYGYPHTANASNATLKPGMVHQTGTCMGMSPALTLKLVELAQEFEYRTEHRLTDIDY